MIDISDRPLGEVLGHYTAALAGPVDGLRAVPPGLSGARLWRVEAGRRSWALRRWPDTRPPVATIVGVHRLLAHMAASGIDFVPVPHASDCGQTLIESAGVAWELAPWMPGAPAPRADTRSLATAARALAEGHRAMTGFNTSASGDPASSPAVAGRVALLTDAQQHDWRAAADAAARSVHGESHGVTLREFGELITRSLPPAADAISGAPGLAVPLQPIIRDARREHFLFSGGRVTGLVDFGAVATDTVAVDLARLLGEWAPAGGPAWDDALDAYGLEEPLRRLVPPLHASGIVLSACNWVRWIAGGRAVDESRLTHLRDALRLLAYH